MALKLKTPKRYQPNRRKRRLFGSLRWLRNLILLGVFAYLGYVVFMNQAIFRRTFLNTTERVRGEVQDIQLLQSAPTPIPDKTDVVVNARIAYQSGELEEAITLYRDALVGVPNDVDAHYQLVYLLLVTSNLGTDNAKLTEALEVADQAINANPESPKGWAIKAMALVWAERYSEALTFSAQALEIDPSFTLVKALQAQAYLRLDRGQLALSLIDEAVEDLRQQGQAPAETIAIVFRTQGFIYDRVINSEGAINREAAIAAYQRALEAAPSHTFIVQELAASYIGNGQNAEALALVQRALEANPRDVGLLFREATIYVGEGNAEEAEQSLVRCIEINSGYWPCYSWLGGLQWGAGNYAQSVTTLQRSIDNGSTDYTDWYQLGVSHFQLLRCDLAIPILNQGYELAVQEEDVLYQERFVDALSDCNVGVGQ